MKLLLRDFRSFLASARFYSHKRIHQGWTWFEAKKGGLVGVLIARRGTYARPFLHTSLFVLIAVAITAAPVVKSAYDVQNNDLTSYTAPSAVLTSFDDQGTATEISDKPRDEIITYTVEDGDTVGIIAEKFNISTDTIRWSNDLKNDLVKPGQELQIPPVTGVVVKVKKGDTIYTLAKKYDTNPQKIVDFPFNDFTDLDTFALAAGQTLIIPDGVIEKPVNRPVLPTPIVGQIAGGKLPPGSVGATPGSGQFSWPTQGVITQKFSYYHPGIDIANNAAPAIGAADGGKVILVEYWKYDYGHHVIIDHGNGYQTLYGHMTTINVKVGENVSKGQIIGKMGSTGRSTGIHLHFEIRKGGAHLNPLSFLK